MPTPVVMPQLGESVVEGVVVKWRVKVGDLVKADDPLAEVETDKATTEVPSPAAGRVAKLLVKEGEAVGVGKPILEIEDASAAAAPEEVGGSAPVQVPLSAPLVLKPPARPETTAAKLPEAATSNIDDARISPVVRKMAEEHRIDLRQVKGTGDAGRITKKDVQAFLDRPLAKVPLEPSPPAAVPGEAPPSLATSGPTAVTAPVAPLPPPTATGGDQLMPFSRRRRLIAERMSQSRRTIPEVTTFAEVDMSRVAQVRGRYKSQAARTPGAPKLTYLPFVCVATVRALREYPLVNSQVLDDASLQKADINLGVAVDSVEGLTVPVIKRADELSLVGLARATEEMGEKGRQGKLTADDLSGGTFTVSNPGLKGNLFGTPIINLPQAGILRMGEVVKRPVVIERDGEDTIVIRPMMFLAFAYDHRIIDGVVGNSFLHRVKETLETYDFSL